MSDKSKNSCLEFSIIIPIYNVERYLKKCVESVLSQTVQNYEIILVDDGSPDNCGIICDHLAQENNRIKVIHKENGGLSSARNAGINIANGKYLIFLDSDDYWDDKNALYNISNQLEETDADVLVFPAKRYYEENNKYTYILNLEVDRKQVTNNDKFSAIKYLLENNIYRAAAWNKVVRKSIVDKYAMRYKEGYLSEDMEWCGDLLIYAKRFDFYKNPFYVYRQQRVGSITKDKSEKLVADKIYMCEKGLNQAINESNSIMGNLLASYYAYEYSVSLGVSGNVKNRELLIKMKSLQRLLKYDICAKVKKVSRLKKIVGYEMTRKILCLFIKIKR